MYNTVQQGGGCFLVTSHATAPDFHLFEMMEQYTALAECSGWRDGAKSMLASVGHLFFTALVSQGVRVPFSTYLRSVGRRRSCALSRAAPQFPHLAAAHDKFKALPANAAYLASPLYTKLPFNNKMAVFGSAQAGARYVLGQAVDWHGTSGKY